MIAKWAFRAAIVVAVGGECKSNDTRDKPTTSQAPASPPSVPPDAAVSIDAVAPMGGARVLSTSAAYLFTLVGKYLYWCGDAGRLHATSTAAGGPELERGPCKKGTELDGDERDAFYCDDVGIMRLPPEGPAVRLAAVGDCLVEDVDVDTIFYSLTRTADDKSGLYRIARSGGASRRLLASEEEPTAYVDGDQLWIVLYEAGVIERMPKRGGKPVVVMKSESPSSFALDGDTMYWMSEGEIRMRAKRGGAVSVVADKVDSRWFVVHGGAVYWITGVFGEKQQIARRGPGDVEPTVLVRALMEPQMVADANGVYFSEIDKPGIYALP
ncbi:hypothetical protein BH11MYX3_BH11MYX3_05630 [soil metagenome]